jgi:hypothetical protein
MMPEQESKDRAAKKAALAKELAQVVTVGLDEAQHLQQLLQIPTKLALQSFIGSAAFAGQGSDNSYQVQFNTGNTGYSSVWPQWAFDQAKPALLAGKKLWVISDGDPYGNNLLQVLILPQNV